MRYKVVLLITRQTTHWNFVYKIGKHLAKYMKLKTKSLTPRRNFVRNMIGNM
jgi:hypothetical protein